MKLPTGCDYLVIFVWVGLFGMLILVHLLFYIPILIVIFISLFTALPSEAYAAIFILYLLLISLIPLVQSFFRRDIKEAVNKIKMKCLNKVQRALEQGHIQ